MSHCRACLLALPSAVSTVNLSREKDHLTAVPQSIGGGSLKGETVVYPLDAE